MYALSGGDDGVVKAHRVFDEMTERSVVTWNTMLAGYLRCGFVDEVWKVFDDMPERNVVSWTTMIDSFAHNGRNQPQPVSLNNALIHMYASCGLIDEAYGVFNEMRCRSVVSWTTMITGLAKQGHGEKALGVFRWMQNEGDNQLFNQLGRVEEAEFDGFTYSFVLNACAKLGFLREGEQVHGRILCKGVCSDVFVQTNLVNMYALSGGDVKAHRVFDEMTERSVVTWNTMLAGYLRCGFVDEVWKVFDDMPERNVMSWTTMIDSFAHNGRSRSLNNALIHMYASCGLIDEAYGVFNEMRCRSVVSWTTMITGLAKQGHGEKALGVFRWMQNEGDNQVRPYERTFLGVLCACIHSGMVE
ncbi:hypothetical protein IFM89_013613 [Coptis chinensis]|uniref:Pentatricopeptide repeat-containing protein n=1 Tax=Coptis chinensis TaxID=261450 RepID=A0A835M8R3_9MAGN|nr:hypothetical protein IFM89_013613 [Coptis chinensis]